MLHLSDAKITVFLVSVVAIGCATAVKHPNQRLMTIGKNLKRDAPVGNHFAGGNIHGGFGQQGHQQFQLQTLSHQGLDGHQGSHFVMPHYNFGGSSGHAQGHNFAHAGTAQYAQLAKILNTQGAVAGGHIGGGHIGGNIGGGSIGGHSGGHIGGFSGAGFGQSFGTGALKTAPVTFSAAPSTTYGTPAVSGHLGGLGGLGNLGGGLQGASFIGGHGFGGSLGGLQGFGGAHNLGNSFGASLKGADFGGSLKGADFGANNHLLLGQNYAASFGNHQLQALPQSSSAQTVPAYAVGIKGLSHYSSGGALGSGGIQSYGDLGTQATYSGGHGSLGSAGLTFDTTKYNIPTYSSGKTLAPIALSSNVAANSLRHTTISNIVDQMKNPFKPSVFLGMYADAASSGESHAYGGNQGFSNLKFAQTSLPSYSAHNSGVSYDGSSAGYNTINYSEGTGH
ncbi:PE-PGRS family protein PE_PGRS16-like [Lutzomyia longipalpis]|uniref:PE-PGRS family protein PE_PGRS16-like n=1 Tax=Lutzomyia longipalpis TaxID=7200 RepID=UPI002483994E|nr:PE-PGRS family protein PE_PGRS16-like [Lutzomyia longipalpis]